MTYKFNIPEEILEQIKLLNELGTEEVKAIQANDFSYVKELNLYELIVINAIDVKWIEKNIGYSYGKIVKDMKERILETLRIL